MKKFCLFLATVLILDLTGHSQPYTISATLEQAYTLAQVDSILSADGVPNGAITTMYAVRVYKVEYNTYTADSIPTTASGLLVVPQGTPCEVPILSYQHNNSIKKSEVPSRYSNSTQWFVGLAAGSLGYITLMPDGIGLGDGPGYHPFLQLQSEATSVIDMIRSVKEFVDTTGCSPNEQLFLAGVSEGAYASVAAHQYIQAYLDSAMHVTGTGGLMGYYDMSGVMVNAILSDSTYPDPSYLPELMLGYNNAYNFFAQDSDMFIYPYDSTLPPLFNGNNSAGTIDGQMPSVPNHVLQPNQLDSLQDDSSALVKLLARNNVYNWAPTSPVYLLYCLADEYVPYQHSTVAYQHFVNNGSNMVDTFDIGALLDHAECGQFSVLTAIQLIKSLTHQPISATVSATNCTSPSVPNGTATVSDTLGDPPYTWRWSNGDSTATITGLAAGTYYVTTTDRARCTNVDSVTVLLSDGISDLSLANIAVYPNPTQGLLMVENQNANEVISKIEISDVDGNVISAPQVQNGNVTRINMSDAAKGVYFVSIRSLSGKELHRKVVLL